MLSSLFSFRVPKAHYRVPKVGITWSLPAVSGDLQVATIRLGGEDLELNIICPGREETSPQKFIKTFSC